MFELAPQCNGGGKKETTHKINAVTKYNNPCIKGIKIWLTNRPQNVTHK